MTARFVASRGHIGDVFEQRAWWIGQLGVVCSDSFRLTWPWKPTFPTSWASAFIAVVLHKRWILTTVALNSCNKVLIGPRCLHFAGKICVCGPDLAPYFLNHSLTSAN